MNEFLGELIAAATAADGQPPFSDQSLVDLSAGIRRLLTVPAEEAGGPAGAALVAVGDGAGDASSEAELVVHPDARRRGLGERLLLQVMDATARTGLLIWAHGDHPGARTLASKHGFAPVRELLQLRASIAPLAGPASVDSGGRVVRPFRAGVDDSAWLDLNSRAFAAHPEQGKLTQRDLDARKAEAWFDPADFLLLWDGDELVGFSWLKVDGGLGEFYAVGVDPARQGQRIGRTLVEAGLARLAQRGIRESNLYVEADNEPAVRLYRSYGFTNYTVDIQYRR
jgi:mycothiol synthase